MVKLLEDGFSTKISFTTSTFTLFEETAVTAPGYSGGGSKNATTMRNTRARTKLPKKLLDVTNLELTVRYDPAIENQVKASLQVNQKIVVQLPDGDSIEYWGWLEEFNKGENTEGDIPTADIVIEISNLNATKVETLPAYIAAVGP